MKHSSFLWLAVVFLVAPGCTSQPPTATEAPSSPVSAAPATAPSSPTAAASPAAEANTDSKNELTVDTSIVPGDHVGPITASTSYQELVDRFGADALSDEEIDVGEGFIETATRLDLGEGRSLSIIWADDARTIPAEIRNLGSAWKLPEGIGIGTSFSELQTILGSFELAGFGWDYGGTLDLSGSNLAAYDESLILRVQPAPDAETTEQAAFEAVMGDAFYPSDDPNVIALNPSISEIIVYFPTEE